MLLTSPPIAHGWEQMLTAVRKHSTVPEMARELIILLLNRNLAPVFRWWVSGAYPVSWDHSTLNSMESNLLIESVELSYAFFERDEIA